MTKYAWIITMVLAFPVFADDGGNDAQYLWTRETAVQNQVGFQLGIGKLDKRVSDGVAITNDFNVEFVPSTDFAFSASLPLAGTLSSGPDNYGIGNIVLGSKYIIPLDRIRLGIGVDFALPSAQSKAAVGNFTRPFEKFVRDQFALSPYLAASYAWDRFTLSGDFGTNLQIYTKDVSASGLDKMEDVLFYDFAFATHFYDNLWGTLEFGGYSTTTYPTKSTQLFAGPGIRYQDHALSFGVHFWAPFRSPAKDAIDFSLSTDVRVMF